MCQPAATGCTSRIYFMRERESKIERYSRGCEREGEKREGEIDEKDSDNEEERDRVSESDERERDRTRVNEREAITKGRQRPRWWF